MPPGEVDGVSRLRLNLEKNGRRIRICVAEEKNALNFIVFAQHTVPDAKICNWNRVLRPERHETVSCEALENAATAV